MIYTELINKYVKIVYLKGGEQKAVYGTLLAEDDSGFKLKFSNDKIIGIGKETFIWIGEWEKEKEKEEK